ncbi:MAG TPA: hypothetical protein ENI07_10040 [Desulfobacterales bacterium]|nr:hypothetical protein [Desulfobacterales bacterium]
MSELSKRHEIGTESITREWNRPSLHSQKFVKISAHEATGAVILSWHRGEHFGTAWCIEILLEKHPEAASYLMQLTGMDEKGTISLG